MKKLLEISHLKKSFGDTEVLKDISMEVNEGEVVAILGPSGSGKSTLLRCATLLETMDAGTLKLGGETACEDKDGVSVYVGKKELREIKNEVEKEAKELLKKVGLDGKENSYPCQLSGGQQQRVAIARALAMNPEMLFFDEPTSALDPEITAGILKVLRQLADEKMTMIIVTHEIEFARKVADRVIFMDGGVIVEQGKPEDVIDNPSNERTKAFLQKMEK